MRAATLGTFRYGPGAFTLPDKQESDALSGNHIVRSCWRVDDARMRARVPVWGGAGVAVAALVGLGVYFATVGLDEADKLASVIGVFVAVAGLGVAVYGLIAERRTVGSSGGGGEGVRQRAKATGRGRVRQAGRDINNGPAQRPASGQNDGDAPAVRQQAKAGGDGQVDQAGRDINER